MDIEVKQWFEDGHKIVVVLDGEDVHLRVICPGLEHGRQRGLQCGMGDTDQPAPRYCHVTEMVNEFGLETHVTGLAILLSGELPIDWGYFGEEEFFFKCASYPSFMEVKAFRAEAIKELLGEYPRHLKIPREMFPLLPVRPWSEVDEEAKQQLREDLDVYIENQHRKEAR
jgi:hypothetical protein